jgi:hypothetical protein
MGNIINHIKQSYNTNILIKPLYIDILNFNYKLSYGNSYKSIYKSPYPYIIKEINLYLTQDASQSEVNTLITTRSGLYGLSYNN